MKKVRNIGLTLQYEGTRYQGWQKQKNADNTIQGKLEALLEKMCGEPVELQGSGRTDAGVHARAQTANFKTTCRMSCEEIRDYMNRYLPEDIVVRKVREAGERFHSRLNVTGKLYRYEVDNGAAPDVFRRRFAVHIPQKLDVEAMRQAAQLLCGTHDFAAFCSVRRGKKSTVRTITSIRIEQEGEILAVYFKGNGFLHHMVRILMGTLLEVGKGERAPLDMERILRSEKRECAGETAPAKGLTLWEVYYEGTL